MATRATRRTPPRQLSASLAALDVDQHYVLGLPDGGCSSVDGTALVTAFLVLVQPSTIVTFGPDGMTGHPDHRTVSGVDHRCVASGRFSR